MSRLSSERESLSHVRHQSHKPGAFDRCGNRVLTDGGTPRLTAADDLALTACELLEQFDVFVINKHRARTNTIDKEGVLFLGLDLALRPFFVDSVLFECRRFGHKKILAMSLNHLYGESAPP